MGGSRVHTDWTSSVTANRNETIEQNGVKFDCCLRHRLGAKTLSDARFSGRSELLSADLPSYYANDAFFCS